MTIEYRLGGTLLASRVELVDGVEGFVSAAERGAVGSGGVVFDDPSGDLTFNGWAPFTVDDTAATPTRVWTGYAVERSVGRGGKFFTAAGRTYTCMLIDQNTLLKGRVPTENAAKRPAETDVARVTWILSNRALSGSVTDEGLVATSPAINFLAEDLRRTYAVEILTQLADVAGKNFFVYRDTSSGNAALFYDADTAAVYDSTLAISNVASDYDGTTTFAPSIDAELLRQPEEIYDGVSYGWQGDPIYAASADTFTAYAVHRDAVVDFNRVGLLTTAQAEAKRFLNIHSTEKDIITVSLRLPSAALNKAYAGQRIPVRFSHLPGYESATYTRIRRRTAKPSGPGFWDVKYELWVPPTPVSDATDTSVCDNNFALSKTWIVTQAGPGSPMSTNSGEANLSDGVTDTSSGQFSAGGHVTSGSGTYTFTFAVDLGASQAVQEVKVWWWSLITFETARAYYSDTGTSGPWTEVTSATPSAPSTSLSFASASHRYWAVGLEHYYVDFTYWTALASDAYSLTEIEVLGCTTATPITRSGGWVTESLGFGDGTTTAFTTTTGFVPGTLTVRVDHLDQTTAVTVTDASAGTFSLAFAPTASEQVDVTYQAS